jgi:CheY-like chemotaxis protein
MPKGGLLTFETRQLRVGAKEAVTEGLTPGDYMAIEVRDTGTGMLPEVVAKIFEPFFTTKGSGRGSGLGLSMVYGFVKQSGGHVKVESEIGSGTTFTLFLPRGLGAEAAAIPEIDDDEADQAMLFANGETILAVDDNAAVRATVAAQLTSLGYYVIEADGGPEALQILQGPQPVDLLFTDIVMPGGMEGRELAARTRTVRPGLKVLFTSGFAGTERNMAANPLGEAEFLSKPYRRTDLARAIHKALTAG